MRTWRKLHKAVTASEKATGISDAAFLLWHFLMAHQDDKGRFPWHRARVMSLCTTRDWDWEDVQRFGQELFGCGLVSLTEGFAVLYKGDALNGNPDKRLPDLLYPETISTNVPTALQRGSNAVTTGVTDVATADREDKSKIEIRVREEGVQGKHPAAAKKKSLPLKLLEKPSDVLEMYSEEEMIEVHRLFPAINLDWEAGKCLDWHNSRGGSKNWKLAFKNWLTNAKPIGGNDGKPKGYPGQSYPPEGGLSKGESGKDDPFAAYSRDTG